MSEQTLLDKVYDPRAVEPAVYALWERSGAFRSHPTDPPTPHDKTFTIVMPPPNVTGALHLGHALNNTLQDILIRYHRMRGFNTLWQPGTDHAGIATQAVVERRIRETEGKSRHDLGREELVRRIWQWKDEYEKRIISQLKLMGCSCDWERRRFTLDDGMSRAVRHQFFKMFKDGLIFRGKRLVNWDTQLQTAVSDDEVYHETVKGHFWHFKYPVFPPRLPPSQGGTKGGPAEPEFVIIATTRPETMLGDTAVAVHPDPEGFFQKKETELKEMWDRLSSRSGKEAAELQGKIEALAAKRESHLAQLLQLRDMARDGRKLRLPLVEREIPLIADEWADPTLGSGCVKITPAHDANDYEVGLRHNLPMINVLTSDGKIAPIIEADGSVNPNSKDYEGLTFAADGRAKVVADMESRGLLGAVEDRDIEVGHSDRSKFPIEPYLSDQWFVRMGDGAELSLGDGSQTRGLAQAAMNAATDGRVTFFPPRYAKSYLDWLGEERDWCISRQLWWGHRIPVWHRRIHLAASNRQRYIQDLGTICWKPLTSPFPLEALVVFVDVETGERFDLGKGLHDGGVSAEKPRSAIHDVYALPLPDVDFVSDVLRQWGFLEDPDVLDTWFSSCLWPFSTLGWPEDTPHLRQYYPGSVLVTARDIITNWVARMVMSGLYLTGKVPFDRVYITPKILDGRGETMSKSKGNGVDPVDIIHTHGADALRYSMADLTTETQDIHIPVEYMCPHCAKATDQAVALKTEEQNRKSRGEKLDRRLQPADCVRVKCSHKECGKEFATQWADADLKAKLRLGRETSEKFEIGRNFCNKLWNAARFAFMNLEGAEIQEIKVNTLPPEDGWILARLSQTVRRYHECLATYQFSASVKELRDFFWDSLCDWYLELTKPRFAATDRPDSRTAKQVLAFALDQTLRLWHPTIPFITERLWGQLNTVAPRRGLPPAVQLTTDVLLIAAEFPPLEGYPALDDEGILATFGELQDATRGVRELRSNCNVPSKDRVTVTVVVPAEHVASFGAHSHIVRHMAGIGGLDVVSQGKRPPNAGSVTIKGLRIYVHNITDDAAEQVRARKTLEGVEKRIAGKEAKLNNSQFVANAKPEVVAAERGRLDELLAQRASLREHLAELGG
ncbi:MAG: valine--tRNA ligase [Planctomycetota bacterium]